MKKHFQFQCFLEFSSPRVSILWFNENAELPFSYSIMFCCTHVQYLLCSVCCKRIILLHLLVLPAVLHKTSRRPKYSNTSIPRTHYYVYTKCTHKIVLVSNVVMQFIHMLVCLSVYYVNILSRSQMHPFSNMHITINVIA